MADNWEQKELSDEFQDKLKNLLHKDLSVEDWIALINKIGFHGELSSDGVVKCQIFSDLGVNFNHHCTNMGITT